MISILSTYTGTLRTVKNKHKSRPIIDCWQPIQIDCSPAPLGVQLIPIEIVQYTGTLRTVKNKHKSRPMIDCWAMESIDCW